MKKLQLLFIVAAATLFMSSNVFAELISFDLSSANYDGKAQLNHSLNYDGGTALINPNIDLTNNKVTSKNNPEVTLKKVENYIDGSSKNASVKTHKKNDGFLSTEEIDATWLTDLNYERAFGTSQSGTAKWAPMMLFTKSDLQNFKGTYNIKQINNIQFYLNGNAISNIAECTVMVWALNTGSNSFSIAHQQVVTNFTANWNTVALSTPYVIPANVEELLIGYALVFTAPAQPFGLSKEVNTQQGYIIVYGQQLSLTHLYNAGENNASWLMKAGVTAENSGYQNNASLTNLMFPGHIAPDNPFTFSCEIANWSSNTINSLEISCKLGDEEPVVLTADNQNLAPGSAIIINSPPLNIPANHSVGNTYPVVVTITKVNGAEDDDVSDNTKTSSYSVYVIGL